MNKPNPSLLRKSAARLATVQCIYRSLVEKVPFKAERLATDYMLSFDARGEEEDWAPMERPEEKLFNHLLTQLEMHMDDVDHLLEASLKAPLSIKRIGVLMRAILRAGIAELTYTNAPPRAVISEYVTITADFFDEGEAGLVNAILDSIAHPQSQHG